MQEPIRSTILIVDDDAQVLRSLCFLLQTEGYHVLTFGSAAELLSEVAGFDNACLVVDYRMPDMNGLDLLVRVRDKYPQIPAVLITGHPDETIDVRAAKLGIKVIRKPHLDDGLLKGIHDALAQGPTSAGHHPRP